MFGNTYIEGGQREKKEKRRIYEIQKEKGAVEDVEKGPKMPNMCGGQAWGWMGG
jgi:hypothetical protein